MKILLVEDDSSTLSLLNSYLSRRQCEVVTATDGADAISEIARAIKTEPFDLMVVDVAMRYVDGYALAKSVRCFESNGLYKKRARIMFHTAYSEAFNNHDMLKQTQVDPRDCFIKATDTERLFETLQDLTA